MELPPETPLNKGHRICGMDLEFTEHFIGFSRHLTDMSTVAAHLVVIVGVTSLHPHATDCF